MKPFTRRSFVTNVAAVVPLGTSILMPRADVSWIPGYLNGAGGDVITDEAFWYRIKNMFTSSPGLLNLNNGGVSPSPLIVQDAHERYLRLCNEAPSYYMWRILDQGREPLRERLADLAGVSTDEVAICRNASEALETIIFGLRLQRGDKVVLSRLDYPNMIHAWKQREHRDGVELKWVDLDLPAMSDDEVVESFRQQIISGAKIVHVTHIINWNGHILPVRRIADIAHQNGAQVVVDGAHTFGHIQYTFSEIGADYFGTSLHKWLCAPFGSGMIYVKKEFIANLYPLLAHAEPESDDIRKFEALGTRSFASEQAIGQALDFYHMLGGELKQKRLQYLKSYWTTKATSHKRSGSIQIRTAVAHWPMWRWKGIRPRSSARPCKMNSRSIRSRLNSTM